MIKPTLGMIAVCMLCSCKGSSAPPEPPPGKTAATITVTTASFPAGGAIPAEFTCDGTDVSPALAWSGAPAAARSIAVVVDDPDAPGGTFTHWIAWNARADTTALAQGAAITTLGGVSGQNDFDKTGYSGPCPPKGQLHHYHFRVYALDTTVTLGPGARRGDLDHALNGHVLAQGELIGTFRH